MSASNPWSVAMASPASIATGVSNTRGSAILDRRPRGGEVVVAGLVVGPTRSLCRVLVLHRLVLGPGVGLGAALRRVPGLELREAFLLGRPGRLGLLVLLVRLLRGLIAAGVRLKLPVRPLTIVARILHASPPLLSLAISSSLAYASSGASSARAS